MYVIHLTFVNIRQLHKPFDACMHNKLLIAGMYVKVHVHSIIIIATVEKNKLKQLMYLFERVMLKTDRSLKTSL